MGYVGVCSTLATRFRPSSEIWIVDCRYQTTEATGILEVKCFRCEVARMISRSRASDSLNATSANAMLFAMRQM